MKQANAPDARRRKGLVLVLTAIMLVPLFGFVALAVDATFLMAVKKEAENAAESAALAGVLGLVHTDLTKSPGDATQGISDARDAAQTYAAKHSVGEVPSPTVDRNETNDVNGDILIGRLRTWGYQNYPWEFDTPTRYNAVRVTVKRTAERNGPVGLFFANIFGISSSPLEAVATARIDIGVVTGFNPPDDGTATLLPFAVCVTEWDEKIYGIDPDPDDGIPAAAPVDEWKYAGRDDNGNPVVTAGSDGLPEVLMFPQNHGGGPNAVPAVSSCGANTDTRGGVEPGNFGTVDIGRPNNSTAALVRQILYGMSSADFDYMAQNGIDINLSDANANFDANGETGISNGIRKPLESIIGDCRMVMLYSNVRNPGGTAQFTVVRYQPIRIVEVHLNGFPKYVRIQPAICRDDSAIIDPNAGGGNLVFQNPRLIE